MDSTPDIMSVNYYSFGFLVLVGIVVTIAGLVTQLLLLVFGGLAATALGALAMAKVHRLKTQLESNRQDPS